MIRTFFFLIVALLCVPALANDIAVAAPDGKSGWFLLEEPLGPGGNGLSDYAGDPGLPAPDALGWPHSADAKVDGSYPTTELWEFSGGADRPEGVWKRSTSFLEHQENGAYRRTLYAVFLIEGVPHVLHYDPYQKLGGYTQVLRVDEGSATKSASNDELVGRLKHAALLNSKDFLDAPEVSPDGKHIAFRTAAYVDKKFSYRVRVFSTADWKLVAELNTGPTSRFTWAENDTLAYITWEGDTPPKAPQAEKVMSWYVRLHDSHAPKKGALKLAKLADGKLTESELLTGEFPPDHYTRTLQATSKGLLIARKHEEGVVVELHPTAGGAVTPVAEFETFRGCAIKESGVIVAGIRTVDRSKTFVWIDVPFAEGAEPAERMLRQVSTDGHGGLIDLGYGITGIVEAVVNPEYDHASNKGQLLRHTLAVLDWYCDSMRNPRVIRHLSKMVKRFDDIGDIRSTLLVFDIEIAANGGKNEKKGRYVELYGSSGRKGKGRIRTEDNLGGQWIVQAIDGGGETENDEYYDCVGVGGAMRERPAKNVGKAYDDLVTQLEARKLLMLTDVDRSPENGGLMFLHRGSFRDPNSGAHWRTWVFRKYGRVLDTAKEAKLKDQLAQLREDRKKEDADFKTIDEAIATTELALARLTRELLTIHFVADLPNGSAGDWKFPHALAKVEMRFALSNQQNAAVTNLYFEPDKWVALPNVTDLKNKKKDSPDLLLPKVFRIFGFPNGKPVQELKAVAVDPGKPVKHPEQLVRGGELQPGYEIPLAFSKHQFIEKQR